MAIKRTSLQSWALPGIVFTVAFGFAACGEATSKGTGKTTTGNGDCVTTSTGGDNTGGSGGTGGTTASSSTSATTGAGAGGSGGGGDTTPTGTQTSSDNPDNTFDHFNDPGASGQKDPFEILAERAAEGPPEIRTRLHSCTKVQYASLGTFLTSRGVNLNLTSSGTQQKTAGELYKQGGDAMGVAHFDAREGETYFHTTSGATKLFDIFVQAAPEIIANIKIAPGCQITGVGGSQMFDSNTSCNANSLSCIMGRTASADDLALCSMLLQQADGTPADIALKKNITVAAFLSASQTCE